MLLYIVSISQFKVDLIFVNQQLQKIYLILCFYSKHLTTNPAHKNITLPISSSLKPYRRKKVNPDGETIYQYCQEAPTWDR